MGVKKNLSDEQEKICRKGKNHFEITKCGGFPLPFLMHKSELNEKNPLLMLCLGETKQIFIKRSLDNLSRQV